MVVAAAGLAGSAAAHGVQSPCNPYYIMEKCRGDGTRCKAHMHYAPGHSLADRPAGNYFYSKPHRWHYHDMFGHAHQVSYSASGNRKYVKYKRLCVPHHHK